MKYFSCFSGIGGFEKNNHNKMFEKAKSLYEQGLTQAEVGNSIGVSQKVIWGLFKRNGYKSRVAKKRNQLREHNDSWKGEGAGYAAMHRRVEKERGLPQECAMCDTLNGRMEWANITGNYNNIYDYVSLCSSCHKRLDRGGDAL